MVFLECLPSTHSHPIGYCYHHQPLSNAALPCLHLKCSWDIFFE